MMLGKRQRPRPPIKRTTSMTEFVFNLSPTSAAALPQSAGAGRNGSGRNHRRNSVDFTDSAHFLRFCSLCNRRLVPGHDIFMYRGDSGFCSLECRQQQIIEDERKEKCNLLQKEASTTDGAKSICISEVVVSTNTEAVAAVVM